MARNLSMFLLSAVLSGAVAVQASAQDPSEPPPLRVYLQCAECNASRVLEELNYIGWIQDEDGADIHVIARPAVSPTGASIFELEFVGLGAHEGRTHTLRYAPIADESDAATGEGLRRMLALGLMRYLAGTPLATRVQIGLPPTAVRATGTGVTTRDPWNFWTFTVGGGGSMSGESTTNTRTLNASFSANRTTAAWKLNFRGSGSTSRRSISYTFQGRDTTSITTTESSSASGMAVRSITGHTSVGVRANVGTSTVNNTKFYVNVSPAIEYNIFPYSESTRRALIANYSAGFMSQKYREETIYFRMEETRPLHTLNISYSTSTPWGSASLSLDGSQYLHNTDLYNLGSYGSLSLNLVRGLSLNFSGSYSRVRDQITLPRRAATQEEVLLRQRTLATDYRYSTSMSLSYRFGSSVQTVVNPRFSGSVISF